MPVGLQKNIMRRTMPSIKYCWIFITDRCQLDCDYCFFSSKTRRQDLSLAQARRLLSILPKGSKTEFVISGGEPLLRWDFVKTLVRDIKKIRPKSSIVLQSNMLLLTDERMRFLRRHNISLEPGIDGNPESTARHRKGTSAQNYRLICTNIKKALRLGIEVFPTMTVHPQETRYMARNFGFLSSLGVSRIDVHPAFLAAWDAASAKDFIDNYRHLAALSCARKRVLCPCYSRPMSYGHDLVVLPQGDVLANWTFMAFPKVIRDRFFILKLGADGITYNEAVYQGLLAHYRALFKNRTVSYREFSNYSAALAMRLWKRARPKAGFRRYRDICRTVKNIDKTFLMTPRHAK